MVKQPVTAVGSQIAAMQYRFPQFTYRRRNKDGASIWRGTLQPGADYSQYLVEIQYRLHYSPKVFVKSPELSKDAPHLYNDGSLCLYYPEDNSWTPYQLIAHTIVPWTAEWLYFYEVWKSIGQWFGPQAPHRPREN